MFPFTALTLILAACEPGTIVRDVPDGPSLPCDDPLMPEDTGDPVRTTPPEPAAEHHFLMASRSGSAILEIEAPLGRTAACSETSLSIRIDAGKLVNVEACDPGGCDDYVPARMLYFDRTDLKVAPEDIELATGDPVAGPVVPVVGPDDLLYLCKDDAETQSCHCIPWFPPEG